MGAKFEHVIDNIKLLVDLKKKLKTPTQLTAEFTCNRLNYHEIPQVTHLASQLGVDDLEINMLRELFFWKNSGDYKQKIHNELACSYTEIKKQLKNPHQIKLTVNPPGHTFPGCCWPFRACNISDGGYVTPCCLCVDPEVINFGNIFQTPLAKKWNNKEYREFRRAFIHNKPPKVCTNCQTSISE